MACESSDVLNRCHSSYLYPLWRFFRTIGYPFFGVSDRQSFPTRKTCAPFGAEAGGDGVGSGPDYLAV